MTSLGVLIGMMPLRAAFAGRDFRLALAVWLRSRCRWSICFLMLNSYCLLLHLRICRGAAVILSSPEQHSAPGVGTETVRLLTACCGAAWRGLFSAASAQTHESRRAVCKIGSRGRRSYAVLSWESTISRSHHWRNRLYLLRVRPDSRITPWLCAMPAHSAADSSSGTGSAWASAY